MSAEMDRPVELTPDSIGEGELLIRLQEAIERVHRDILDETKKEGATRTITATIKITPAKDSAGLECRATVDVKLAPKRPVYNLGLVRQTGLHLFPNEETRLIESGTLPFTNRKENAE